MSTIRPRLPSDLDDLCELATRVRVVDAYPIYLRGGDLRRFLTEPSPLAAWVAEDNGRMVGHVAANPHSHEAVTKVVREAGITDEIAVVARLLVDPDVRRRGIGEMLLAEATRYIASLGRAPVLDVVESARAAVSLYRRVGWRQIGTVDLEMPGRVVRELVFTTQT